MKAAYVMNMIISRHLAREDEQKLAIAKSYKPVRTGTRVMNLMIHTSCEGTVVPAITLVIHPSISFALELDVTV